MTILAPFLPAPGVNREGTRYTAEGVWYDNNLIRWRKGLPEEMGGWTRLADSYLGIARRVHDWGNITGTDYLGVGSALKLYINDGSGYNDITPVLVTQTLGTDPITTTAIGSGLIDITVPSHGAVEGDFVVISGVVGSVGGIAITDLNIEHRVVFVFDSNTLSVVAPAQATSVASGGGTTVVADNLLTSGLNTYVPSSGWGTSTWGAGFWGGTNPLSLSTQLRLWTMDNYGNDLVCCPRLGPVHYWTEADGVGTRAVALGELTRRTVGLLADPFTLTTGSTVVKFHDTDHRAAVGDSITISGVVENAPPGTIHGVPLTEINAIHLITGVPTDDEIEITITTAATATTDPVADPFGDSGGSAVVVVYRTGGEDTPIAGLQVMTSPTARHIIVFGANAPGETDPEDLLVRWSSSEVPSEFTETDTNTAGRFPISTGSKFVGAIRTRQEIIVWTDSGVVSMRYVGAPFVFAFTEVEQGVSMISPNAAVNAGGVTFFMDRGTFYAYDGGVRRVPCSVRDYIFSDIDLSQAYKVTSGGNRDFSEVQWHYPSKSGGGEVDSYVKFNYDENLWDYGRLNRGTWNDAATRPTPRSTSNFTVNQPNIVGTVTISSPTVSFDFPNHKLTTGDQVLLAAVADPTEFDPLVYNTLYAVTVVDSDTFTVTISEDATASGTIDTMVQRPEVVFVQEDGFDDDGEIMPSFVESGDFNIEEGHNFWFVTRFIPDVKYRGVFDDTSEVGVQLRVHDYPGAPIRTDVDVTVNPLTTQKHVRTRARQISLRIDGIGLGYGYRVGKFRIGARKDGRR